MTTYDDRQPTLSAREARLERSTRYAGQMLFIDVAGPIP